MRSLLLGVKGEGEATEWNLMMAMACAQTAYITVVNTSEAPATVSVDVDSRVLTYGSRRRSVFCQV
jgi:hypothetical protein